MDCKASTHNHLECMLLDASAEPRDLPISLLKDITKDFSDDQQIGRGGFAVVYKGLLQNGTVAVKKLFKALEMDDDKFIKEVTSLMRVKHKNIVRFLGYCADTQGKMWNYEGKMIMAEERRRLLCFEFLPKGSLDKYITDISEGLEWRTRYQIIKGICEGLHYLHQNNIVHLDLKPENVLLNDDMVPKLADFGLSRCFHENQSKAITKNLVGSPGYLAPEFYSGLITFKSDIYSLGVIITEILTGQKASPEIDNVLQGWSTRFKTSGDDKRLEQVRVCAKIGIKCIHDNREERPLTGLIIEMLAEMESKHGFTETDPCTSSVAHEEKGSSELRYGMPKVPGGTSSETCTSDVSKFTDGAQPMGVSTAPSQLQRIVCVPKESGETSSSEIRFLGSTEISKLLDVHPLELRFPFEPNKRIQCPVNLTNRTDQYVGIWIRSTCTDTCSDLHFPDSWDNDSGEKGESLEDWESNEEEGEVLEEWEFGKGEAPEDPLSYFHQIIRGGSTAGTEEAQTPPAHLSPPQSSYSNFFLMEEEEEEGEAPEESEWGYEEEEGESPKDPLSYLRQIIRGRSTVGTEGAPTPPAHLRAFFVMEEEEEEMLHRPLQIMEPHSTWAVAMTMKEKHELPLPPRNTGKFEVVMIIMGSEQGLKNLEPSIGNKLDMDDDFLKRVEELGGKVHLAMLTAVICDPASCQAAVTQQIISTKEFGVPLFIDVDSTKSWILCAHAEGYVSIWNYQTQERVMALQIIKKDTYTVSATKFITRKQWFAAGDNHGYVHVYDYTTFDNVKKFKAYGGKSVSSLAVHPTKPFLLSSSDQDLSSIKLWDWDEGWVCTRIFDGYTRGVLRLMFNPRDINTFASVHSNGAVKVWNIDSSNPIITVTSWKADIADYFFNGRLLVVCEQKTECECARIWDLQIKERVHKLFVSGMDYVACHPTLPILVTKSCNKTVCFWNANTYRLQKMVRLTRRSLGGFVITDAKDLTRLLVPCEDGIGILEINLPAIKTDL